MAIPLDPGRGGHSISGGSLQTADIIVSTAPGFVSGGIRGMTGSEVSHAGLYIGNGQVVEAVGEGVRLTTLEQSLEDHNLAVAYRVPFLTMMKALQVRDFVGRQIGKAYNYAGVAARGAQRVGSPVVQIIADVISQGSDKFYCSQLVVAAFQSAGIWVGGAKPGQSTPAQLASMGVRGQFLYVGHLLAENS